MARLTKTGHLTTWDTLLPPADAGSLPEKTAAWYSELGGLATGLAILSHYTECCAPESASSPRWFAIRPTGTSEPSSIITPPLSFSAAVKYSGLAESFSLHAGRGKQSSTGQRLRALREDDTEEILRDLWTGRPDGTLTLVIQELVDIAQPGALFHAYSTGGAMTVELIGKSGRSLLVYNDRTTEPAYVEHLPAGPAGVAEQELTRLARELWLLLEYLAPIGNDFNVEGFVESATEHTWMFQLRPAPNDRPRLDSVAQLRTINEPWSFQTRYTWGVFDEVVVLDGSDRPSENVFYRTLANFDSVTAALHQRLREGGRALLVDTVEGFRLSHEPWNLPDPAIRDEYRYMFVPSSLLAGTGSVPVRLHGDGDTASARNSETPPLGPKH